MKQKLVELIDITFGFRKFIAWLGLFLIGVFFRLKGYMDGGQFVDLTKNTFLAFCAANQGEHLLLTVRTYLDSKGKQVEELVDGDAPK